MHAHTHPFILFVRKDVRSTDVFPVVASLPIFRRERSDDRKYVCASQATKDDVKL